MIDIARLRELAEVEFADIVVEGFRTNLNELRIVLVDGSFIDVWFSLALKGRYSYHWERTALDGTIYRHDNAPHKRWESIETFPKHFHQWSEDHVVVSYISNDPEQGLRVFLAFARKTLSES